MATYTKDQLGRAFLAGGDRGLEYRTKSIRGKKKPNAIRTWRLSRLFLLILFPVLLFAKKIDPQKYTHMVTVISSNIQSKETGATITNTPPVLRASDPRAINHPELARSQSREVKSHEISFVQITGEFNNLEYTATGQCFLPPGTYKVSAEGLNLRFLTKDKHGNPAECRFQIVQEHQPSPEK